ncbi:MAG: TRAP transporter small permease subunit, partial [Halomonas sp.]|nr:TRAP transporter small permease subunit [Halomonas sp.]
MKFSPDARPERWLGSLALAVISLISLGNVITRYVSGGSLAFTEEFSVFLLVVLTFAGASVALRRNGHIRIGLLERHLPAGPRRALILFQGLCGATVLGLITW